MIDLYKRRLAELQSFDPKTELERCRREYPGQNAYAALSGAMSVAFKSTLRNLGYCIEALEEKQRYIYALEWAVEHVLTDAGFESVYHAMNLAENALAAGISLDTLRQLHFGSEDALKKLEELASEPRIVAEV